MTPGETAVLAVAEASAAGPGVGVGVGPTGVGVGVGPTGVGVGVGPGGGIGAGGTEPQAIMNELIPGMPGGAGEQKGFGTCTPLGGVKRLMHAGSENTLN